MTAHLAGVPVQDGLILELARMEGRAPVPDLSRWARLYVWFGPYFLLALAAIFALSGAWIVTGVLVVAAIAHAVISVRIYRQHRRDAGTLEPDR